MSAKQEPYNISIENEGLTQAVLQQISSYCEDEKNLMISLFDIKRNKFLYCNDSFNNVLGYNTDEIISGGWEFWYKKIDPDEARSIKNQINHFIQKPHAGKLPEVLFIHYHIKDTFNKWYLINHELSLFRFKKNLIALNYLYDISQKERLEYFFGLKRQSLTDNLHHNVSISSREKEVLMLIAEGFSSKQIADELYISNHTAISHRKNLIEKFNVKNTAQLIRAASKSILF